MDVWWRCRLINPFLRNPLTCFRELLIRFRDCFKDTEGKESIMAVAGYLCGKFTALIIRAALKEVCRWLEYKYKNVTVMYRPK